MISAVCGLSQQLVQDENTFLPDADYDIRNEKLQVQAHTMRAMPWTDLSNWKVDCDEFTNQFLSKEVAETQHFVKARYRIRSPGPFGSTTLWQLGTLRGVLQSLAVKMCCFSMEKSVDSFITSIVLKFTRSVFS